MSKHRLCFGCKRSRERTGSLAYCRCNTGPMCVHCYHEHFIPSCKEKPRIDGLTYWKPRSLTEPSPSQAEPQSRHLSHLVRARHVFLGPYQWRTHGN